MFEFSENHFYKVIWLWSSPERNLMGAVYREPDGQWKLRYRWRHFRDDKIFGSGDKRVWYSAKLTPEVVDEAIAGFDEVLRHQCVDPMFVGFKPVQRINVEGDGLAAHDVMVREAAGMFHSRIIDDDSGAKA